MTHRDGSNSLPRGRCPACQANVALRRGGELREHRATEQQLKLGTSTGITSRNCPGSGFTVEQVQAKIDAELEALRKMSRGD